METHLEKHDPDRNLARYYRMSVLPNLFGEWTLQREWGRIGQGGRVRLDLFRSEVEAECALVIMEGAKQRRAYTREFVSFKNDAGRWLFVNTKKFKASLRSHNLRGQEFIYILIKAG